MILVARGHDPAAGSKPEEPGALKVFDYRNGLLTNEVSVAPNGRLWFRPPSSRFSPDEAVDLCLSLERQNKLDMFGITDHALSRVPIFRKETLGRAMFWM